MLQRMMSRRKLLRLAGAGTLAVAASSALGACATTARPLTSPAAQPAANPAFTPDLDVTMRATPSEVQLLPWGAHKSLDLPGYSEQR